MAANMPDCKVACNASSASGSHRAAAAAARRRQRRPSMHMRQRGWLPAQIADSIAFCAFRSGIANLCRPHQKGTVQQLSQARQPLARDR